MNTMPRITPLNLLVPRARSASRGVRGPAVFLLAVLLAGCATEPTSWSGRHRYEPASDLSRSRSRVAAELAADAEAALAADDDAAALRWGSMAAHLDSQYAPLEAEARRRVAAQHIARAEQALADKNYALARSQIDIAADLDPDAVSDVAAAINRAESDRDLDRARRLLDEGDVHQAVQAVRRAERLDADNPNLAAVRDDVFAIDRAARLDQLTRQFDQEFEAGRLSASERLLDSMEALQEQATAIVAFRQRLETRQRESQILFETGTTALRVGDYEAALTDLERAGTLNADLEVAPLLAEAEFGRAREVFLSAMDDGDRLAAFEAAHALAALRPEPQIIALADQVGAELIANTSQTARALAAEGKRAEAIAAVRAILDRVESAELEELVAELSAGDS